MTRYFFREKTIRLDVPRVFEVGKRSDGTYQHRLVNHVENDRPPVYNWSPLSERDIIQHLINEDGSVIKLKDLKRIVTPEPIVFCSLGEDL